MWVRPLVVLYSSFFLFFFRTHLAPVIVTSWALFVFCISWNFSKKLSTSVIVHQTIFYQIIKINKTQLLLKYFFGARGVKFLENRRENVQILQALRWRFDVWEAIFAVKIGFFHKSPIIDYIFSSGILK